MSVNVLCVIALYVELVFVTVEVAYLVLLEQLPNGYVKHAQVAKSCQFTTVGQSSGSRVSQFENQRL